MSLDRTTQELANLIQQSQTVQPATAPSGGRAGTTIALRVDGRPLRARCLTAIAPGPVVAVLTATGWACLPVAATMLVGQRQVEFRQRRGGVVPIVSATVKYALWRAYPTHVDVYIGGSHPIRKVLTVEADFDFSTGSFLQDDGGIRSAFGVTLDNTGPGKNDWVVTVAYVDLGVTLDEYPGYASRLLIKTIYGDGRTYTYTDASYPTWQGEGSNANNGYGFPLPYSSFVKHGNNTAFGSARNPQFVRRLSLGVYESVSLYEGSLIASSTGAVNTINQIPTSSRIVAMGVVSLDAIGPNQIFRPDFSNSYPGPFLDLIDLDLASTLRLRSNGGLLRVDLSDGSNAFAFNLAGGATSLERLARNKEIITVGYTVDDIISGATSGDISVIFPTGAFEFRAVPIVPADPALITDIFITQKGEATMGNKFDANYIQIKAWVKEF